MLRKKIAIAALLSCTISTGFVNPAYAQNNVHGQYNPKAERAKPDSNTAPIPKIFSKKIQSSTLQALKLDTVYQNLKIALWNYAQVDLTQQSVLLDKMQTDNFRTTRYKLEFKKDLDKAIASLNANYKGMNEQIDQSKQEYEESINGVTSVERELLDALWAEKIKELKNQSETYFKMQHNYILMYQKLTEFIVSKNGSYYFDENAHAVKFYDVADYTYYAGTIDKLNSMTIKQKKFLKETVPNSDFMARKEQ